MTEGNDALCIAAVLAPTGDRSSIRAERLPPEALDLLAWAFRERLSVDPIGAPMNAAEVRLDDPVRHILHGGDGFRRHAGSDSLRYFRHADDPEWAVVFAHDRPGDPVRGAESIGYYGGTSK